VEFESGTLEICAWYPTFNPCGVCVRAVTRLFSRVRVLPEEAIWDGGRAWEMTDGGAPGPSCVRRSRFVPSYWSGGHCPCRPSEMAMYSRPNAVMEEQKVPGVAEKSCMYVPGEFVQSSTQRMPLESK